MFFLQGELIINGKSMNNSLLDMIIETQKFSNPNNVIKFNDNSRFVQIINLPTVKYLFNFLILCFSAIKGFKVKQIKPTKSTGPSSFTSKLSNLNLVFTAETHNFPTGVEPFRCLINLNQLN